MPRYTFSSHLRMLTLEWRNGKLRALPWERLIDATLEDGELLLSFARREVDFHRLNLGDLLEAVVQYHLEKIWELPDDYQPPAHRNRPSVNKIEVRELES